VAIDRKSVNHGEEEDKGSEDAKRKRNTTEKKKTLSRTMSRLSQHRRWKG
jgi:hypothetical protein